MKIKFILLCSIFAISFASCSQDELSQNNSGLLSAERQFNQSTLDNNDALLPFAKALYYAMKESPKLREMIKKESLEKFNKEYETLYQFIKDEKVENGLSVRDLLLKYFNNEESLAAIESNHPTLTLHIPILPKGSFSAEIWNTKEQVPAVAIHPINCLNTILVAETGQYDNIKEEFVIEAGYIPAFPVVVLKDNNRVVVSQNVSSKYPALNNKSSDYVFDFIDDYFDGSIEEENEVSLRQYSFAQNTIDSKVINAYNIFGTSNSYWQRDHIYYNLTTSTTTGTISSNYSECIYAFSFSNNYSPQQVLNQIIYPGVDPSFLPNGSWPWSAGQFNFRITAEIASQTYPTSTTKLFAAYPEELFSVTWTKQGNIFYNTLAGFNAKEINLPLFTWNLGYYSHGMKIAIWKVNQSGTATSSYTLTTGYATNVSYTNKDGFTFGSTTSSSVAISIGRQYNISDIYLGDAVVSFGDPVITGSQYNSIKQQMYYNLKEYTTGICIFMLTPKKQY